jgi:O-acetylserine/cysteine efflux transporter
MLGFVAFIGFGLAYATWYSALKVAPIDEVAPFMLVMPVVGIATAWALLGEPITAVQIFGGVVILLGLALVSGVGQSRRGLEPARQE